MSSYSRLKIPELKELLKSSALPRGQSVHLSYLPPKGNKTHVVNGAVRSGQRNAARGAGSDARVLLLSMLLFTCFTTMIA